MKKLLSLLGVAIIGASSMFANVEMEFNLYGTPTSTINLKDRDTSDDKFEAKLKDPFGFETQFEFMFGAPAKFIDIGMGLSWGMDFFNKAEMIYDGNSAGDSTLNLAFDTYMTLGPAVRFHVGDMHSFLVSPGLICNFMLANGNDMSLLGFYSGFNLDLGYRIWVVNKTGFHFGFDVGADLNFPFAGFTHSSVDYKVGSSTQTVSSDYDITGGTDAKIYFGVCFNFGDKAPDKARNKVE